MRDEVIDAFASLSSSDPYAPYEIAARLDKIKESRKGSCRSVKVKMTL